MTTKEHAELFPQVVTLINEEWLIYAQERLKAVFIELYSKPTQKRRKVLETTTQLLKAHIKRNATHILGKERAQQFSDLMTELVLESVKEQAKRNA